MKFISMVVFLSLGLQVQAQEPDYSTWTRILRTHYDRVEGMGYEGLAQWDWTTMKTLVKTLGSTDTSPMTKDQQLAYYLNLYNITVVNLLMENRQVHSIRDLSTDPFIRFNIFRKDLVLLRAGRISLKRLEDEFIRNHFKDPRIHFAINCAARSCPPIRMEAFTGEGLQAQLDDQTRAFIAHPKLGVRIEHSGDMLLVHLTKIARRQLEIPRVGKLVDAGHQDLRYRELVWRRLRTVGRRAFAFPPEIPILGPSE